MRINFGTFDAEVNHFAAYFYLHTEPLSPLPPDGGDDVTDEEWEAYDAAMMEFQLTPQVMDVEVSYAKAHLFLTGLAELVEDLHALSVTPEWNEEEVQSCFYEAAKSTFGKDKKGIREFFKLLYMVIFQAQSGPRWGQFMMIVGYDRFVEIIRERSETLPAIGRP